MALATSAHQTRASSIGLRSIEKTPLKETVERKPDRASKAKNTDKNTQLSKQTSANKTMQTKLSKAS